MRIMDGLGGEGLTPDVSNLGTRRHTLHLYYKDKISKIKFVINVED